MPKTKKKVRSRTGYVMVELTPEERADLESLRELFQDESIEKVSLASVLRRGLRDMRKKFLKDTA